MNIFRRLFLIAAVLFTGPAYSQSLLLPFEPGPRLIDGSALNKMVNAINTGLITATYYFTGTPAATDTAFFVANQAMKVIAIRQVHSVAAGGTSTLQVTKDTSTSAPGAGTDLLATAFNLNATANTVQTGSLATSSATLTLAAGDRLAVDFADAIQSSAGVVVTVTLAPIQ